MIVKLLVLVALAFSLGDLRDATEVSDEVSLLEAEPTDAPTTEAIAVARALMRSVPREAGVLPEVTVVTPRSRDAGRVFRPPELITV